MYGSFGIERYNTHLYLRKFSTAQLQEMFLAFQQDTAVIQQALQESIRVDALLNQYQPLHPQLLKMEAEAFISPELLKALGKASPGMLFLALCFNCFKFYDVSYLGRLLRSVNEEAPDVFSFSLLDPAKCSLLLEEVEHYSVFQSQQPQQQQQLRHPVESAPSTAGGGSGIAAPTTRSAGYAILEDMGLGEMLDIILQRVMNPLAHLLYSTECYNSSTSGGGGGGGAPATTTSGSKNPFCKLDWRHGYVISYR
jgi:hypothetical protein